MTYSTGQFSLGLYTYVPTVPVLTPSLNSALCQRMHFGLTFLKLGRCVLYAGLQN